MFVYSLLILSMFQVNVYQLPIGSQKKVAVRSGQIVETKSNHHVSVLDIAKVCEGYSFVYLGETHTDAEAHRRQSEIINALVDQGRNVIVGFEMLQRPKQFALDLWSLGKLTEGEFLEKSDWKQQWGFDFGLYRPIFEVVRKNRLRAVALNIPRDWVRAVGRGGIAALPEDAKDKVPELDLSNNDHKALFHALMGGHPESGSSENIYAAQVLWDEAMADSAIRYLQSVVVNPKTVFVVVAGNGHVMYHQGINYRVEKRTKLRGITVVMLPMPSDGTLFVNQGIADFVIGTSGELK
jgi:uncharacterized iron-regulated protein